MESASEFFAQKKALNFKLVVGPCVLQLLPVLFSTRSNYYVTYYLFFPLKLLKN